MRLLFDARIAIFEKHGDDLFQVTVEFVQALPLTMRPRESRHVPHVQSRVAAPFHDCRKRAHRDDSSSQLRVITKPTMNYTIVAPWR